MRHVPDMPEVKWEINRAVAKLEKRVEALEEGQKALALALREAIARLDSGCGS